MMEPMTDNRSLLKEELEEIGVSLLEATSILQNARIVSESDGAGWETHTLSAVEKMLKGARERLDRLMEEGL